MKLRFPGSLSARITIGFMVLVAIFGGISLWTVITLENLNRVIRSTHTGYLQLSLVSGDLDSKQTTLRGYLREDLHEEHSQLWARKRLQRLIDARQVLLEQIEGILADFGSMDGVAAKQFAGTEGLVGRMRALIDQSDEAYQILLKDPPIADAAGPNPERDSVLKVQKRQMRMELQIGQLTKELKRRETKMVLELSDKLDEFSRKTWLLTLLFGAIAVVFGILMTIGARVMLRPLQRLRDAAGRISRGDYAQRIMVQGPREIADLAREFNVMGQAIQERSRELVRTERLATAGKMAAMITHEVRNPLSSIGLNTELLEEELVSLPPERASEAQSLCRAITTEVDRLTAITEEYLQLTRLPTPKLRGAPLERVVRSVVEFVRDQLLTRDVAIELDLPEEGPTLALDEGQIRQALLNLIRNAADAVEEQGGGVLKLSIRHSKEFTELVVSDNGPGIPDELLDQVFEAFVSSKSSGTGLGLALTHQIIGDHGGTIKVSNEGGAVFRIKLPHKQVPIRGQKGDAFNL